MAKDIRVTLVFDPFGIWAESADLVRNVRDELEAFRQIEHLLRRDDRFETVTPKTFLVHPECWEHFQSYRGVGGVTFHEVTPRRQLAERLGGKSRRGGPMPAQANGLGAEVAQDGPGSPNGAARSFAHTPPSGRETPDDAAPVAHAATVGPRAFGPPRWGWA